MQIVAHGIDLVECSRIDKMLNEHGEKFIDRVFTQIEKDYSFSGKNKIERLCGRFAVKEAVFKLIGTGWRGKIAWTDIEVVNDDLGRPNVTLSGEVKRIADELGIKQVSISITHTSNFVIASAVALANEQSLA